MEETQEKNNIQLICRVWDKKENAYKETSTNEIIATIRKDHGWKGDIDSIRTESGRMNKDITTIRLLLDSPRTEDNEIRDQIQIIGEGYEITHAQIFSTPISRSMPRNLLVLFTI